MLHSLRHCANGAALTPEARGEDTMIFMVACTHRKFSKGDVMKKFIITSILAAILGTILGGCQTARNSDDAKPELSPTAVESQVFSKSRDYSVTKLQIDLRAKRMSMSVRDESFAGAPELMELQISRSETSDGWGIGSAALLDMSGDLLWEFRIAWPVTFDSIVAITEKTAQDSLTIIRSFGGGHIRERYVQNGRIADFEFNEEILSAIQNPELMKISPSLKSDCDRIKRKFESFYNAKSTLAENRHGTIVADILSNDSFSIWLRSQADHLVSGLKTEDTLKDPKPLVCAIASVCATIKCSLPPWLANPLCVPCTGIGLACAIADIISWFE
jgi:hypothetical protein